MSVNDALVRIARGLALGKVPTPERNELYSAGAFDGLIVHASDGEAFALLTELCARFPEERRDPDGLRGYLDLLLQLARQSKTTEMPTGMQQIILAEPAMSGELSAWYRAA